MSENNDIDAERLSEVIKRTFSSADSPATARDIAGFYGVLAAQQEALLAVYALAMKANPKLIFEQVSLDAGEKIALSSRVFEAALIALAEANRVEVEPDE